MKQLNLLPGETLFILNEQQKADLKLGLYLAMKLGDEVITGKGSDKDLVDRLEIMYESL